MNLFNIIEKSTDFGSHRSKDHLLSFALKILLYMFPAVVLGHSIDTTIHMLKKRKTLGDSTSIYILLQTIVNIIILYTFELLIHDYVREFQRTIAGSFFIVLYFGTQTNYIKMFKDYLTTLPFTFQILK